MHDAALLFLHEHLPAERSELSVLEFGSRNINGSIRDVIGKCDRFVGVDIERGPGVDIVADASNVIVDGPRFDVVACAEVFEHATDATCKLMTSNAFTHLRVGGLFLATMAGPSRAPHSAVDGGPLRVGEFYRNVTSKLLERWLTAAGFTYELDEAGDDLRCVAKKPAKAKPS